MSSPIAIVTVRRLWVRFQGTFWVAFVSKDVHARLTC